MKRFGTPAGAVDGVVRIAIPATIFGRWAVHMSHDVGDEPKKSGFVVTHVETGRSIPPHLANHLALHQAEAIARALDEAGDLGLSVGAIDEWTKVAISALVKETLADLAEMEEVRP